MDSIPGDSVERFAGLYGRDCVTFHAAVTIPAARYPGYPRRQMS